MRAHVKGGVGNVPVNDVARKLRVKNGDRIAVLHAPGGWQRYLEPLPDGVTVSESLDSGPYDLVWHFARTRAELERDVAGAKAAVKPGGVLWLSYPKGTSGVETDLKREVMWEAAKPAGLHPVSQIAVDNVWSALRFKPDD